jgi:hypothetical protein
VTQVRVVQNSRFFCKIHVGSTCQVPSPINKSRVKLVCRTYTVDETGSHDVEDWERAMALAVVPRLRRPRACCYTFPAAMIGIRIRTGMDTGRRPTGAASGFRR